MRRGFLGSELVLGQFRKPRRIAVPLLQTTERRPPGASGKPDPA
jgi:hypothetical protein